MSRRPSKRGHYYDIMYARLVLCYYCNSVAVFDPISRLLMVVRSRLVVVAISDHETLVNYRLLCENIDYIVSEMRETDAKLTTGQM